MSFECPHWNDEICQLNGMDCRPGKGHCVLRNRFEVGVPEKDKDRSRRHSAAADEDNRTE